MSADRAGIYLRVSTEEQRERQSIETQRDFALRWCELNQIEIAEVYADEGISGTVPVGERPEGARLLRDAAAGKFSSVLVYRLDRLSRAPRNTLNCVGELEDLGIQVKSMTEPFDTSSPSGRFLLTILSGVAGLERDTIVERSRDGTNRLAREGAWLGGVTPFGYRVEGKKKTARLVIDDEPIPGMALSEADVVRMIYRMSAIDGKSCQVIADHLNALGIPPVYVREGRQVRQGKRLKATAGIWRPGRVRNLIRNTTYKGVHGYGKRSNKAREIIERPMPAIVEPEIWEQAQATLTRNMIASTRNGKRKYLLRGLIKCGTCGLTYIGTAYPMRKGPPKVYYVCNGKQQARGIFGRNGFKCPSKAIKGDLEEVVWRDIEGFIRNPGPVLEKLAQRLGDLEGKAEDRIDELEKLRATLEATEGEKRAVLGLYRRGRIDDATLDQQLEEIGREREHLAGMIAEIEAEVDRSEEAASSLTTAEELLQQLHATLDQPLTWEVRRQLVETLIERVRVDTVETDGIKEVKVTVTYRFSHPEHTNTPHLGRLSRLYSLHRRNLQTPAGTVADGPPTSHRVAS